MTPPPFVRAAALLRHVYRDELRRGRSREDAARYVLEAACEAICEESEDGDGLRVAIDSGGVQLRFWLKALAQAEPVEVPWDVP